MRALSAASLRSVIAAAGSRVRIDACVDTLSVPPYCGRAAVGVAMRLATQTTTQNALTIAGDANLKGSIPVAVRVAHDSRRDSRACRGPQRRHAAWKRKGRRRLDRRARFQSPTVHGVG